MRWAWAVGALGACAVAGCASTQIALDHSPRAFAPEDYEDVYEAWTRSEERFNWGDLRHVLRVTATFESWEFRWAYVTRYAYDQSLEPAEREAMLQASLAEAQKEHSFVVSLIGDDIRESNLTGKQSAWRVLLLADDQRQVVPVSFERIKRPGAVERVYFPSISPQRNAFRVSFPALYEDGAPTIPAHAKVVTLRFTGPRGRVDLNWELGSVKRR